MSKKALTFIMVFAILLLGAVSFARSISDLPNGKYKAEVLNDSHGWKAYVELEVKKGKVTKVTVDEYNVQTKALKSKDADYSKTMKTNTGYTPKEYYEILGKDLVKKQNIGDVDIITGATHTSDTYKYLVMAIINEGQPGKTIYVDISKYESGNITLSDGVYKAEADKDSHGWKPYVTLEVKNGKVVNVTMDEVNIETNAVKSKDDYYAKTMKSNMGLTPEEYYKVLQNELISTQNIEAVDVVTGATSTSHNFVYLVRAILETGKAGETIIVNPEAYANGNLPLADGTYKVIADKDSHGWKPFVEVQIKRGRIVNVILNEVNIQTNAMKSDDVDYSNTMKGKTGYTPTEYYAILANDLVSKQDIETVDTITGATSTSNSFRELIRALVAEGKPGQTVEVDLTKYAE
ncbi:MAG TPA: FMN-binding protein [Tepiditoga sp.]|nr:FMN-binding protein [Tepiditoga sp.]